MSENLVESTDSVEETSESLDDVISQYNTPTVEATTATPTPPQQYAQPQTSYTPQGFDPLDENSVNSFVQAQGQAQSALSQQVQAVSDQLTAMQQQAAQSQVEADINQAVSTLTSEVDVKPKVAEAYLEAVAREKPGFKAIWDNRKSNPQAFDRAMKAVAKEMKSDFAPKVDTQVVADQKAAKQSQQAMASTTQKDANDEWEGLSEVEFQRKWQQMVSGG